MVTLLFRKASARACAPKSPISLYARSSLTSLCINKEDDYHRYDMEIDITLLFFRASARGKMEFRQKEFRHLKFDNVQIVVEFGHVSKFY
jgi:hypothetical protein